MPLSHLPLLDRPRRLIQAQPFPATGLMCLAKISLHFIRFWGFLLFCLEASSIDRKLL